ncbi:hypothetical protein K502DRAFT_326091 [Neoconidiobolus thromboides FSU 785]|nr:hypothetical protein K502DRAFT_326091 [Neoconidiobolus thromboides FSU 785]
MKFVVEDLNKVINKQEIEYVPSSKPNIKLNIGDDLSFPSLGLSFNNLLPYENICNDENKQGCSIIRNICESSMTQFNSIILELNYKNIKLRNCLFNKLNELKKVHPNYKNNMIINEINYYDIKECLNSLKFHNQNTFLLIEFNKVKWIWSDKVDLLFKLFKYLSKRYSGLIFGVTGLRFGDVTRLNRKMNLINLKLSFIKVDFNILDLKFETNGFLNYCVKSNIVVLVNNPISKQLKDSMTNEKECELKVYINTISKMRNKHYNSILISYIMSKGLIPLAEPGTKDDLEYYSQALGWKLTKGEMQNLEFLSIKHNYLMSLKSYSKHETGIEIPYQKIKTIVDNKINESKTIKEELPLSPSNSLKYNQSKVPQDDKEEQENINDNEKQKTNTRPNSILICPNDKLVKKRVSFELKVHPNELKHVKNLKVMFKNENKDTQALSLDVNDKKDEVSIDIKESLGSGDPLETNKENEDIEIIKGSKPNDEKDRRAETLNEKDEAKIKEEFVINRNSKEENDNSNENIEEKDEKSEKEDKMADETLNDCNIKDDEFIKDEINKDNEVVSEPDEEKVDSETSNKDNSNELENEPTINVHVTSSNDSKSRWLPSLW